MLLSRDRKIYLTYLTMFLCYLGLNLLLVQMVYIHHDEGWYLYASQLVYQGKLPYLDFAYFQSPLLPYVYGLFQYLAGPSVLVGRLTTLILNVGLAGLTTLIARRLGGNLAAIIALLCLGTSADFMRIGSYANNVILSTFLAMLGTWWLLGDWSKWPTQIVATGCWSLAVLTRLSFGLGLTLVVGFILWHQRRRLMDAWPAAITPALILLAGLGSFAVVSFDQTHFNLIAAQLIRHDQINWAASLVVGVSNLELILGLLFSYTSALLILLMLGSVLLWSTFRYVSGHPDNTQQNKCLLLLSGFLIPVIYLPNLLPGDLYPSYFASPYPFACILAGWLVAKLNREKWLPQQVLAGITGVAIAVAALTSAIYLSIFISWQSSGMKQLQTLSAYIESITTPSDRLLTFETALAANTGRSVTPGTTMSYFSYFPRFSTEQATRYRVINEALLSDQLIRREANLVLLTDFDVHLIRNPANPSHTEPVALTQTELFTLFPELQEGYYLTKTIPNYSEWNNHLYVIRLNQEK